MYDPLVVEELRKRTTGGNVHRVNNALAKYINACDVEERIRAALSFYPESSGLRRQLREVEKKELCYVQEMRRIV